ncbi:MAG TPA: hypothetical protein VF186_00170 [Gaiellaceae bacterium]
MQLAIALAVAGAAAAVAFSTLADGAAGPTATPPSVAARPIGSVSGPGLRAALLARRVAGSPPTAQVVVTTYQRDGAAWKRLASRRLAGTYFWNTVTGPRAICNLQLVAAGSKPHVTVQLLVTPSIGCGKAQTVPLPR